MNEIAIIELVTALAPLIEEVLASPEGVALEQAIIAYFQTHKVAPSEVNDSQV